MSERPRICLVAPELHPLTDGGIGRLLANLIHASGAGLELHVLLLPGSAIDAERAAALHGVRVHRTTRLEERPVDDQARYPTRLALAQTPQRAEAIEVMLALRDLERAGVVFDMVEFPDVGGWAAAAIQERRLGLAFARTRVAVRLHGTAGIIAARERRSLHLGSLALHDLERKCLRDADLVIAPLATVADELQRHYGFPDPWRAAVRVEFPPVVDAPPAVAPSAPGDRDLLFVTRLHRVKQPDLFVAAAARFMDQEPAWQGRAVLACHDADGELGARVLGAVPAALRDRFLRAPTDREERIARGIVVIPSAFECLSLTAYEAAAAGAILVLNAVCPAFGDGSPFHDGVDCHKFDGSLAGLVEAMRRAWRAPPPERVAWRADPSCWDEPAPVAPVPHGGDRVSVLITNCDLGRYLPTAIASVVEGTHRPVEVVLVDDASTEPFDRALLDELERGTHAAVPLRVIRRPVRRGLAAALNAGLACCTGDFVLPLDADDAIGPRFLEVAVAALRAQSAFDGVVPTQGWFHSDEDLHRGAFVGHGCFLGDAPTTGLLANRLAPGSSLFRREALLRFGYDETLPGAPDWAIALRMTHAGLRFLVTNDVQHLYRVRATSQSHRRTHDENDDLMQRIQASLPMPLPPCVDLDALRRCAAWRR